MEHKVSIARLLQQTLVSSRVTELRSRVEQAVLQTVIQLAVTERVHRLEAIRDRWETLCAGKGCFAREDFEGAMTITRKKRWSGGKELRLGLSAGVALEPLLRTALQIMAGVGMNPVPADPPNRGVADYSR